MTAAGSPAFCRSRSLSVLILLVCSPLRLACMAAWSRLLFSPCGAWPLSLEARSLRLLRWGEGARMAVCLPGGLGGAGSAGAGSGPGPKSSSRLSGTAHEGGAAVILLSPERHAWVLLGVRVVITAGCRVKTHARGDRVCSVWLCGSEHGCGRVNCSLVESWAGPCTLPVG